MANILTDLLATRDMTPILSIEKNKLSSLQGESKVSIEKILIKTDGILKKEGSKLYIDKEIISLEQLNVLDVLTLLNEKGVEASFINDTDYWYYPALCILDFSSQEVYEEILTSSPVHLIGYKYFKNLSINPLDLVSINIVRISNPREVEALPYRIVDDLLLVERGFTEYTKIIYSIQTKEFTLKLGNKFSSQEIETVSRYLEDDNA